MTVKQPSFSDLEHAASRRSTKRSDFLHAMDEIIVWDEWVGYIRPYYYSEGGRGRPAKELETMLRMYFLQVLQMSTTFFPGMVRSFFKVG